MYWEFELTTFSFILMYHNIGISSQYDHNIAYVFVTLASLHGICALLMIFGSLWQRKLVFALRRRKHPSSSKTFQGNNSTEPDLRQQEAEVSTRSARVVRFLSTVYHRSASQHGVFGVKGRHFHIVLMCREVVEVVLQSVQAIRMSKYLPRLLLNRFYVSLLAINCCSSVFVYSRWFSHNEARRRFAALLCDCTLNLMTTIGVSVIIMLHYVDMYDLANFKMDLIDDDEWIAQTLNEARVVLVMSWLDLATRVIFSLGLVATTSDMKALLRRSPKRKHVVNAAGSSLTLTGNLGVVPGQNNSSTAVKTTSHTNIQLVVSSSTYKGTGLQSRKSRVMLQGVHILFAVWGVVILALHLHASKQTPLHECAPKVLPMAGALPSCYAVEFNCYNLGLSATENEVKAEWKRFDRTTTVKLRILHCQSLEVPDSFQDFSVLQEITIYNTTILNWGDSAAITNTRHPKLRQIYVVRVNMTDGLLPLGFQSRDFPVIIIQICFCETNLATIPDDLKWPVGLVYFENSKLTNIPSAFIQHPPFYIALTGNPLTYLQPEMFEVGVSFLYIGDTFIDELPQNLSPTILSILDITNTNISFFPMWMDSLIDLTLEMWPTIIAGGSTYCFDLDNIMNGVSTSFSASFDLDFSSILMNASEENWELLSQIVDCSPPQWSTQYPLGYDDAVFGLGSDEET